MGRGRTLRGALPPAGGRRPPLRPGHPRPGEAEDACQEAWLRIWRAWGQGDPDRRDAWVLRIVRNACLERRRWFRRRPTAPLGATDVPHPVRLEELVIARVEADSALDLLTRLPLPARETLYLREVAELSYAEIAEVQGVPVGTVMSRLHSARRRVARLLEPRRRGA